MPSLQEFAAGTGLSPDTAQALGAPIDATEHDDEAALERLAALSPIEYDRRRVDEAKALGIRPATLDALIKSRRPKDSASEDGPAGRAFSIDNEAPYAGEVDGGHLLSGIVNALNRHVMLPDGAALPIATWIFGSYVYDSFPLFPKLLITSPEKRCGKSTLAAFLAAHVARALACSSITPAALFRCVEKWRPTLILDEADTFLKDNEELRGVINAGHTQQTAFIIRVCGDDHEPRAFSTWAPMIIAMIKRPADTIVDRSLVVQMRRRMPGEAVEKMPIDFADRCRVTRQKLTRWAADHAGVLGQSPTVPAHSSDRCRDNWTPLFSIAEAIGGDWPTHLEQSFKKLNEDTDDDSAGPAILRDIRSVFQDKGVDRIFSDDLVAALVDMDEAPWSEWRHGKPITMNTLARLLKPFKVSSGEIRIGYDHRKGYEQAKFADAFTRYLSDPPIQTATTRQATADAASGDFQSATPKRDKNESATPKPTAGAGCRVVADGNRGHGPQRSPRLVWLKPAWRETLESDTDTPEIEEGFL